MGGFREWRTQVGFREASQKQTAEFFFENTTRTQHTRGGGDKFSRNSGTETRRHYKSLILNTSERSNCAANGVITFERQLDQSFIQEYGRQQQSCQQTNAKAQAQAKAKAKAQAKAKASKRKHSQAKATRKRTSWDVLPANQGLKAEEERTERDRNAQSTNCSKQGF